MEHPRATLLCRALKARVSFSASQDPIREETMPNFASAFLTLPTLLIIAAAARAQTPVAPVPTYPSDKAVNVLTATSLKWHKTDGATGYAVQVSTDAAFTMPFVDDSALTDTLDHVSHLADTTV